MPDSNATSSAEVPRPLPLVPVTGRSTVARAHARPSRQLTGDRPLPDAACIYPVAIPPAAPPYDDAPPAPSSLRASSGLAIVQPPAAHACPVPADPSAPARSQPYPGQPPPERQFSGQPAPGQPPAGGTWPSRFAQVLAETLAGARPPDQIVPWTTERARKRISQLGPLMATAHRPRVKRILVASPTSGVLEMTIIVGLGPRVRALAVRLERAEQPEPGTAGSDTAGSDTAGSDVTAQQGHPGGAARWRCTAVDAA